MNIIEQKGYWKHLAACINFFIVVFTIKMITNPIIPYPHDGTYYWTIGDSMFDGGFNVLNYPETFRGYFFPLLVEVFKNVSSVGVLNNIGGWNLLIGLLVALTFSYELPLLFLNRGINSFKEMLCSVLTCILFLYIWGDFISYPLSDFPAFTFILIGVNSLRVCDFETTGSFTKILRCIVTGMGLSAAYNIRAAYLFGVIVLLIVFTWNQIKNRKRDFLIGLVAILLGAFIVALPQCMINKKYVGSFTPKVFTEQYNDYSKSIQLK